MLTNYQPRYPALGSYQRRSLLFKYDWLTIKQQNPSTGVLNVTSPLLEPVHAILLLNDIDTPVFLRVFNALAYKVGLSHS